MSKPYSPAIEYALDAAAKSPCRSKRGVAIYQENHVISVGWNGPPADLPCPGREKCAGNCGKRSVHAEIRALRDAANRRSVGLFGSNGVQLVHVELAPGSAGEHAGIVACGGPSCWQCAREILDVGFIDGVWLYERGNDPCDDPSWLRYSADEFYTRTLERCGLTP